MPATIIYEFEEIGPDMARPPLAAMCALASAGVVLASRAWGQLSQETRWALARAGVVDPVDVNHVRSLLHGSLLREVRLVPHLWVVPKEPHPDLTKALGPVRRLSDEQWLALRPFDRYVLISVSRNARLLWRAMKEIVPDLVRGAHAAPWAAAVGHCTVKMRPDVLEQIRLPTFLDGRAFVLARAAGVRSARRAAETFDLSAEGTVGVVELDWATTSEPGALLWQAHVSMWDGSFFAAASLSAASAASIAVCDIARELDPNAVVADTRIAEEPWLVGHDAGQEPTAFYQQPRVAAASASSRPPAYGMEQDIPSLARHAAGAGGEHSVTGASVPPGSQGSTAMRASRRSRRDNEGMRVLVGLVIGLTVSTLMLAAAVVVFALSKK